MTRKENPEQLTDRIIRAERLVDNLYKELQKEQKAKREKTE